MANTIPCELGTLTLYRGTKKVFEFLVKDENEATIDLSSPAQTLAARSPRCCVPSSHSTVAGVP